MSESWREDAGGEGAEARKLEGARRVDASLSGGGRAAAESGPLPRLSLQPQVRTQALPRHRLRAD